MALAIGYNITKANEVLSNVKEAYVSLGNYITDGWEPVQSSLRDNWIGDDEQNFEKKFVERICQLYENSCSLANDCINTINKLTNSWIEFQKKNNLDDSSSGETANVEIGDETTVTYEAPISFTSKTFAVDEDRGLRDLNSANTIKSVVETYVTGIKAKTNGLFEEIEVNNAFFGESQTGAIKIFIDKCGEAIGEVNVAVRDMYDALDTLASSSYTTADSDVSNAYSENTSTVEGKLEELGTSRWS